MVAVEHVLDLENTVNFDRHTSVLAPYCRRPRAPGREIKRNLQSEGCRKAVRQQRFTATSKSSQTVRLAKAD